MKKRTGALIAGGAAAVASLGALSAYLFAVRPWHLRWGASREELKEWLPGDDLVPDAKLIATHAIMINAPVREVWPWLAQVGQTRGGFYSYTWLENLVGCHMRNAEEINPEWQNIKVGDRVWLHPKAPTLPVTILEPDSALVLGGRAEEQEQQQYVASGTWGFYLKKLDEKTTRLIIRSRWEKKPGLMSWLSSYALLEPAHFVMERKMMLGIKQRAEAAATQGEVKVPDAEAA